MDKNDALIICKSYLQRVKNTNVDFSEAWLFGSFANGSNHENSDIDIAIILKDNIDHTFETDVQLMIIRIGEETRIEPHAFTKDEFDKRIPIVDQIIKNGIKIEI